MTEYSFTYPSSVEMSDKMLDDIYAVLNEHDLEKELVQKIALVISEGFTNALLHGNKLNPDKLIIIKLEVNDTKVSADISDQGQGGLQKIQTRPDPELMAESGRGINLIRHYASSISFQNIENGGLQLSVTFERNRKIKFSNN